MGIRPFSPLGTYYSSGGIYIDSCSKNNRNLQGDSMNKEHPRTFLYRFFCLKLLRECETDCPIFETFVIQDLKFILYKCDHAKAMTDFPMEDQPWF